jgi:hypothetical protein
MDAKGRELGKQKEGRRVEETARRIARRHEVPRDMKKPGTRQGVSGLGGAEARRFRYREAGLLGAGEANLGTGLGARGSGGSGGWISGGG